MVSWKKPPKYVKNLTLMVVLLATLEEWEQMVSSVTIKVIISLLLLLVWVQVSITKLRVTLEVDSELVMRWINQLTNYPRQIQATLTKIQHLIIQF